MREWMIQLIAIKMPPCVSCTLSHSQSSVCLAWGQSNICAKSTSKPQNPSFIFLIKFLRIIGPIHSKPTPIQNSLYQANVRRWSWLNSYCHHCTDEICCHTLRLCYFCQSQTLTQVLRPCQLNKFLIASYIECRWHIRTWCFHERIRIRNRLISAQCLILPRLIPSLKYDYSFEE